MLVAEFNLPSPEEREARKRELQAEIDAASLSMNADPSVEEKVDDIAVPVEAGADVPLPSAPDLDALSEEE